MFKSLYKWKKARSEALQALYNSVSRVIPYRVARQHCPIPFHHGIKKLQQLGKTIYKFLRTLIVQKPLQRLLPSKATKRLF